MATRSRIGIELNDGSILSAYHHWDGYPEWLGQVLATHYRTKAQVASLIDGGDMSCLGLSSVGQRMVSLRRLTPLVLNTIAIVVMILHPHCTRTRQSSSLLVKNTPTSSAMVSGNVGTCTSLMMKKHLNWFGYPMGTLHVDDISSIMSPVLPRSHDTRSRSRSRHPRLLS